MKVSQISGPVRPKWFHISVGVGLLLTGALHEDGFADSCDGFGGGWDKAQVLAIMKDPRIGNSAALGLKLILLLKMHTNY